MATAQEGEPQRITMDEIELLSFLHQNIVRKLCKEAKQGRPQTNPQVIQAVARYFNLGPAPHQIFNTLIKDIANSFLGESVVHVTPQFSTFSGHSTSQQVVLLDTVSIFLRPVKNPRTPSIATTDVCISDISSSSLDLLPRPGSDQRQRVVQK